VAVEAAQREFFVTVRDAGRTAFLLGPYATHEDALTEVERGRELAQNANTWAWFYAFGTASAPAGLVSRTVFGR
jgi:hypothetical protein